MSPSGKRATFGVLALSPRKGFAARRGAFVAVDGPSAVPLRNFWHEVRRFSGTCRVEG